MFASSIPRTQIATNGFKPSLVFVIPAGKAFRTRQNSASTNSVTTAPPCAARTAPASSTTSTRWRRTHTRTRATVRTAVARVGPLSSSAQTWTGIIEFIQTSLLSSARFAAKSLNTRQA